MNVGAQAVAPPLIRGRRLGTRVRPGSPDHNHHAAAEILSPDSLPLPLPLLRATVRGDPNEGDPRSRTNGGRPAPTPPT